MKITSSIQDCRQGLSARAAVGHGFRAVGPSAVQRTVMRAPPRFDTVRILRPGSCLSAIRSGLGLRIGVRGLPAWAQDAPSFREGVCWATAVYAAGGGQGSSGNAQSQDWTASALKLSYGQVLVGAGGCLLIGIGGVLAVRAAMRRFLKQLDTGTMSHRAKQVVTALDVAGGVARGVVSAAAGVFILVAAVRFDPDEAKGVDATLRSFTQTPVGPWLLVAVAIGLLLFGVFSFASARRRRL